MIMTVLLSTYFVNTLVMLMFFNPTPIIISIILQTILIAILLSIKMFSIWLPVILLLIMIGGMMILFMYMTSMIPNKHHSIKINIMILPAINLTIITLFIMNFLFPSTNFKSESMMTNKFFNLENFNMMTNLFSNNTYQITIFMAIYLLLTMIIIIKITNPWQGPLQHKN
uniref:NADH dehydrogenase subunit 6 n=1 Tax=Campodea fragilis TaxID=383857 RepID=Q0ZD08_9HEXA|nr:NADH dehydrogenase subunit 6 [Campodea fragilis]ABF49572.1 NADH dehydrogenase subunit 6 [Campodea fragilis]